MTGAAGAPRLGDASAWESRIAKGNTALVQSAINGVPGTAMTARGTCGACSDNDIEAAVEYMIAQSL
jgi:cytochrome c5